MITTCAFPSTKPASVPAPIPTHSIIPSSMPTMITTIEMASVLRVQPQTIRAALCRTGHYLGVVPVKLPNGKLLWDSLVVKRLLATGEA